jgi:hypothetical protein
VRNDTINTPETRHSPGVRRTRRSSDSDWNLPVRPASLGPSLSGRTTRPPTQLDAWIQGSRGAGPHRVPR